MSVGYTRVSSFVPESASQCAKLEAYGASRDCLFVDYGHGGRHRLRPELTRAVEAGRFSGTIITTNVSRFFASSDQVSSLCALLSHLEITLVVAEQRFLLTEETLVRDVNTLEIMLRYDDLPYQWRDMEARELHYARGRPKMRKPAMSLVKEQQMLNLMRSGDYEICDMAEIFSVSVPTIHRVINRAIATDR